MRVFLVLLLLGGPVLAQDKVWVVPKPDTQKVWVRPTYTEFFYANARVRDPDEHPAHAALKDAWSMLAEEKAAKRANGGHLPRGYKVYRGGWWYEADGRGGDTFCVDCNGMTEAEAVAWVLADRAKRGIKPVVKPRAPEVPAAPTFHKDHTCPRCNHTSPPGTGTWVVRGSNADGTHTHACPACGTVWRH
jgi:hypothetical protein